MMSHTTSICPGLEGLGLRVWGAVGVIGLLGTKDVKLERCMVANLPNPEP